MKKFLIIFAFLGLFSLTFSKLNTHEDLRFSKFRRQAENLGTVKYYNPSKGYGYITRDSGKEDLYFHQSVVQSSGLLVAGQRVQFEIIQGTKGPRVTKVVLLNR